MAHNYFLSRLTSVGLTEIPPALEIGRSECLREALPALRLATFLEGTYCNGTVLEKMIYPLNEIPCIYPSNVEDREAYHDSPSPTDLCVLEHTGIEYRYVNHSEDRHGGNHHWTRKEIGSRKGPGTQREFPIVVGMEAKELPAKILELPD